MVMYILEGDTYLSDGVYNTVEITKGTLKHCRDMVNKIIGGQYKNITIYKEGKEYLIPMENYV